MNAQRWLIGFLFVVLFLGFVDSPQERMVIAQGCDGMNTSLHVGYSAVVAPDGSAVRLRTTPSTFQTHIGLIPPRGLVVVMDGPLCQEGYFWYQVYYETDNTVGWVASGTEEEPWMVATGWDCGGMNVPLPLGEQARVLDARATVPVHEAPSAMFPVVGDIPGDALVTVTGGPVCGQSVQWWLIEYQDVMGWLPAGSENEAWIEAVLEPLLSPTPSPGTFDTITVTLVDGSDFTFNYDRNRNWILNGSEFVVSELNRINSRIISQRRLTGQITELLRYATPVRGESDRNVGIIKDELCSGDSECEADIVYLIGDRIMDLSGVGNITYGYYIDSLNLPLHISDMVADWDQLLSSMRALEFITTADNPDDVSQRQVGRELRMRELSVSNLDEIANDLGLY